MKISATNSFLSMTSPVLLVRICNNTKVCDTSSTLDISQKRFYQVSKLCPCELIVELKELELSSSLRLPFSSNKNNRTHVNSIKCTWFCRVQSYLQTNDPLAREVDNWIYSRTIQSVSFCFVGL